MLSRLVIAFLPRSKHLLIPWLQSPSAVILEPPQIKSVSVSIVSPSVCQEGAPCLLPYRCLSSPLALLSHDRLDVNIDGLSHQGDFKYLLPWNEFLS